MMLAVVISLFVRQTDHGGFSVIHILSASVAVGVFTLPFGCMLVSFLLS